MTWLFIRFYLCVLVVLALAWYIHSAVLKSRTDAEWERIRDQSRDYIEWLIEKAARER